MKNRQQPEIRIPEKIDVTPMQTSTLDGGVKLYALPIEGDVVRVSFVFHAGTIYQKAPFSASATANMLSEGTRSLSALEIARKLDFYGSFYDVSIDRDYAIVTFCSLSKFFNETLGVVREMVLYPAFSDSEVEMYCHKRKARLALERSKVAFKARELFASTLFGGGHPYGLSSPEAEYDNLTAQDIRDFFALHYTAGNCFIVSSGDVSREVISALGQVASQMTRTGHKPEHTYPEPNPANLAFTEQNGAVQSAIRMGTLLFPRTHPDYIPMQVVTTILGGYFGSRLVRNLREQRGYTYGIFAGMVNLDHAGYMAIATEVASEVTDDAIAQIFIEIERMKTQAVPPDELQMVKNIMVGEVMRILDGPFGIADVAIENIQNGTGNDYLNRFLDTVRAITPEEVLQTARKYLDRGKFTTAVVGATMPHPD